MAIARRRRVAGIALVAAVLWLALPLAGLGHPGFNDDTACGVEGIRSGGITRFQAAATVNPLQHCAICHMQRASRGATPAMPAETAVAIDAASPALSEPQHLIAFLSADRQPARAPPAVELS
jgi:mono/diheme cytochrome c family protein